MVFSGGSGTQSDPWQISTVQDWNNIDSTYLADNFILVNDIDVGGGTLKRVGDETSTSTESFEGVFDGQGYTLKNFDIDANRYHGLFNIIAGEVKNLNIQNASIYITEFGEDYAGILAAHSSGIVQNIEITDSTVVNDSSSFVRAGVVMGDAARYGAVEIQDITVKNSTVDSDIAGVISYDANGLIKNCFIENCSATGVEGAGAVLNQVHEGLTISNIVVKGSDVDGAASVGTTGVITGGTDKKVTIEKIYVENCEIRNQGEDSGIITGLHDVGISGDTTDSADFNQIVISNIPVLQQDAGSDPLFGDIEDEGTIPDTTAVYVDTDTTTGGAGNYATSLTTSEMQGTAPLDNMPGLDYEDVEGSWSLRSNNYPILHQFADIILYFENLSESFGINDLESFTRSFGVFLNQAVGIKKNIDKSLKLKIFENTGVRAKYVQNLAAFRDFSETVKLQDESFYTYLIQKFVYEKMGVGSAVSKIHGIANFVALNQGIGIQKAVETKATLFRTLTEPLGAASNVSRLRNKFRTVTESIGLDAYLFDFANDLKVTVNEAIGTADTLIQDKIIGVVLNEAIGVATAVQKFRDTYVAPTIQTANKIVKKTKKDDSTKTGKSSGV